MATGNALDFSRGRASEAIAEIHAELRSWSIFSQIGEELYGATPRDSMAVGDKRCWRLILDLKRKAELS